MGLWSALLEGDSTYWVRAATGSRLDRARGRSGPKPGYFSASRREFQTGWGLLPGLLVEAAIVRKQFLRPGRCARPIRLIPAMLRGGRWKGPCRRSAPAAVPRPHHKSILRDSGRTGPWSSLVVQVLDAPQEQVRRVGGSLSRPPVREQQKARDQSGSPIGTPSPRGTHGDTCTGVLVPQFVLHSPELQVLPRRRAAIPGPRRAVRPILLLQPPHLASDSRNSGIVVVCAVRARSRHGSSPLPLRLLGSGAEPVGKERGGLPSRAPLGRHSPATTSSSRMAWGQEREVRRRPYRV
jgi:hypothetical protein